MVAAVPRRLPDVGGELPDPDGVALAHRRVDPRHLAGGLGGRHHPAAEPPLQGLDRLDVVAMPVRDQDLGEAPAGLVERPTDRLLLGRVDRRAGAAGGIVDQAPILSARQRNTRISAVMGGLIGYTLDSPPGVARRPRGAKRPAPASEAPDRCGHERRRHRAARLLPGPLGQVARRLVARTLDGLWEPARGLRVLGLGYATPYLAAVRGACERAFAFMPGPQGVVGWVDDGLSASALVDPVRMPLPDASIDRVLAVHALETVDSPVELLHEVWRILVPGGRVVVAAPNRRGLWARMDTTPFGQGQPFSRSQLKALMRETWFAPTAWAETLYVPPLRSELLLRTALAWERAGTSLGVPFAGLHVVEAEKQFRQPVALARARARRAARLPVFVPAPAPLAAPPAAGSARQVLTSGTRAL